MKIKRRQATADDMALLYEIYKKAMKDHVVVNSGRWDESEQRRMFEESTVVSAHEILLDADTPLGFINLIDRAEEIHINRLCIIPEYQSRGIGTALLSEIVALHQRNKLVKLQVFPKNPAANLYRRLGFKEVKTTSTHIHMQYSSNGE